MSKDFSATRLDVRAFAQAEGHLQGQAPLSAFKRLAEDAQPHGGAQPEVRWQAEGEFVPETGGAGQVWLHVTAEVDLPMVCQRCLTAASIPLLVDRSFRFVANEALAEQEDDDSEEDVLALSREFDLLELIEDELLMEVPVVPRHDVCPVPVKLESSDADFEQANEQKENPFAVLRSLDVGKSAD
ncbi:YceD family protein [Comamonas sp. w2-DMI]|uniref:YceD family protein n=1 Tax=Comamonas sp. w2-DMI TaxID=3126391 RepID=UPI0032E4505D